MLFPVLAVKGCFCRVTHFIWEIFSAFGFSYLPCNTCLSRATYILKAIFYIWVLFPVLAVTRVHLPATPLFCNFTIWNLRHRGNRCLCFTTSVFNVEKSVSRCSLKFRYWRNAQKPVRLVHSWCRANPLPSLIRGEKRFPHAVAFSLFCWVTRWYDW